MKKSGVITWGLVKLSGIRFWEQTELYGVPTKALNQAIKRNPARYPDDFMFQLTPEEKQEVVTNCDHLNKLKFSKALPFAFTEHGAIQAANVLNFPQADEVGVYVVRAYLSASVNCSPPTRSWRSGWTSWNAALSASWNPMTRLSLG